MNLEAGIWKCEDGVWIVHKRFKGCDWSSVDFSYEHKTQCMCCAEAGLDESADNLHVYGLDEDDLPKGAFCFACSTTIVSVEKAIEDVENKSSTDGKIQSKSLSRNTNALSKKSNIREESKVSFAAKNGNRDEQKLKDVRLSKDDLEKIYSETSEDLKCFYRGLDKQVCKELFIRWKYDEKTGKVSEMWCPYFVKENGELSLTGYKVRRVKPTEKQQKYFVVGYVGKLNCMFGESFEVNENIVYVGGEVDVVSAIQMIRQVLAKYPSRKVTVVSAPLGEPSTAESIKTNWNWVEKHTKHVLALDNDDAGKKSQDTCKDILPLEYTLEANLALKDANEYLNPKNGKTADDYTRAVYWNPTPCKSFGVKGSKQLLQGARLRLQQDKIPFPAFLSDLAEGFTDKSLWLGEWVNWISSVSSGKSTVFDAWMVSWALDSPYRQAIMSYEADWKSFGVKIASLATARAVLRIEGKENRLKWVDENEDAILRLLQDENGNDRFEFVDELPTSVEAAKDLINFLVKVKGVKVLWIDPMLDFLSICSTKQEYDGLILFLDSIRMTEDVTIMCSMHTRKNLSSGANGSSGGEIQEEDAYGGREVIAKGTINITAQRNKNAEDWVERNTMVINVRKSRNDGGTGSQSRLFYRGKANRLYPFSVAETNGFFESDFNKKVEEIDVNDGYGFSLSDVGVKSFDDHSPVGEKTLEDVFVEDEDENLPF